MSTERIDNLFEFIKSTANAVQILEGTDMPQVRNIIDGTTPLLEGCPSRASAVEFILRGIAGRADELQSLLGDLVQEVARAEKQGEL